MKRTAYGAFLRTAGGLTLVIAVLLMRSAWAGGQQYEPLSDSVRSALSLSIADRGLARVKHENIHDRLAYLRWLGTMSDRLRRNKSDFERRREFLEVVYYEAKRAGLDPELMLALIQVESNFRQHAISSAGARGYTQVMPFWMKLIGDGDTRKLFDMRVNIRFGCVILRHYLDIEKGNLYRALGRYNGSLGRPEYPNLVLAAWKRWEYRDDRHASSSPEVRPSISSHQAMLPATTAASTNLPSSSSGR